MSRVLNIYGTNISVPTPTESDYIENWGTNDPNEQYWRRYELPDYFSEVEFDSDGNALLDEKQREYAQEEVRRCKNGFFFMNCGEVVFITGKNYFYLKWWKLEDDVYPDYRQSDMNYFLFLNHYENIPWCLGIIRGKRRRLGATSQACSNIIYECIFFKNSICGITSKTQIDAKTAFTSMIGFGYRQLPVFLKPKQLNNKDSVTELVFRNKSMSVKGGKGSVIDTDTGHRSKVDYRSPSINAYDSGRLSRILVDEGSKFPKEVSFSTFISIVSKTLIQGAKRVGFMELPSTTNAMINGGEEFMAVWKGADQKRYDKTPNRIVKYMTPAYDGYLGFIDKHGRSVIEEPDETQFKYLVENFAQIGDITEDDIRLGAKAYLLSRRNNLEDNLLEEEIRMNPFDEREMFRSASDSLFNMFKINEQIDYLSYNSGLTERGNLVWDGGDEWYTTKVLPGGEIQVKPNKLIWVANENGKFEKVCGWYPKEANNVYEKNGWFFPNNNHDIRVGCDPFKYDKTKDNRKSNCSAYAYQIADPLNEDWEFNDMFVLRYADRPPTTDIQYENVLKMAWYCGCQALIERNIGESPKKFFQSRKAFGFLMYLPNEQEFGIYTDGVGNVVHALCDYTEAYIEKFIKKVLFPDLMGMKSGWLGFDVGDTQKYDDVMAAGFTLIAVKHKKYLQSSNKSNDVEKLMPYRKAI